MTVTTFLTMIVLGDGGHCGIGYVTPAAAVQLVSQICKLFWLNELELTNQFDKINTLFWKVMILQGLIGDLKIIRSNNWHNLEANWRADAGVT